MVILLIAVCFLKDKGFPRGFLAAVAAGNNALFKPNSRQFFSRGLIIAMHQPADT